MTETYFAEALIPALTRLGFGPIGAFRVDMGPETPAFYLLMPGSALEMLVTVDSHLRRDDVFAKTASSYWNIAANAPGFVRIESSLHVAFASWPKLTVPKALDRTKQIFQFRIYESATHQDHIRKIEMMMDGEARIFADAGLESVFYADTLIGAREPSLAYMLSVPELEKLNAAWDAFRNHPDWKKLSTDPKYAFEPIVSNITNLILRPLSCSQI